VCALETSTMMKLWDVAPQQKEKDNHIYKYIEKFQPLTVIIK
jgi:hypothetical protein